MLAHLHSPPSVHNYLALAHLHSASQLLEASLKFLVSYKAEVWTRSEWKDLMKTDPIFATLLQSAFVLYRHGQSPVKIKFKKKVKNLK